MSKIIIIDDDMAMDILRENLLYRGHTAIRFSSAAEALQNMREILSADLVVLDIIMPWPESRPTTTLSSCRTAGMEVLKEIRTKNKEIPIFLLSAIEDMAIISTLKDDPKNVFISKWEGQSISEIVRSIHRALGIDSDASVPPPFIVHGHDDATKLELKNYLQNVLKLPEPIILHEQPSQGRTIIEKLEDQALRPSHVFILLTPDDPPATPSDDNMAKRRARQNVIFEMGYFMGLLGRRSGRIILLHKGPLEIPSDISGIVYIDISKGISTAGETIRREISVAKR